MILGLDNVLEYSKEAVSQSSREQLPYAEYEVIHMKRHEVGSGKHAVQIRAKEVWSRKGPLRRRDCNKEVGKCTHTDLASKSSNVIIQILMILFVVASFHLDAYQV